MVDETAVIVGVKKPLWRRIVDFPLIALVIAAGLALGTTSLLNFGYDYLPETWGRDLSDIVRGSITILVMYALYKIVLRRLGDEPRDDLASRDAMRGLGIGIAGGFAIMTITVAIAALLGVYRITGWGSWEDFVWILVRGGLVAGFVEELLFRGILFRWVEQLGGSWVALVLTSVLFGLGHYGNQNATVFSSIAIALEAGILLGAAYMYAQSLWLPIGLHFGWNVTQGFIWGVPVSGFQVKGLLASELSGDVLLSGGEFGLEGSIIAVIVVASVGLWLAWLSWKQGKVVPNWWSRRKALAAPA